MTTFWRTTGVMADANLRAATEAKKVADRLAKRTRTHHDGFMACPVDLCSRLSAAVILVANARRSRSSGKSTRAARDYRTQPRPSVRGTLGTPAEPCLLALG